MKELLGAVIDLLTLAEKAGLSFKTADLDDRETIELYAAVLKANGIEAAHVKRAQVELISTEKEFPKPATVLAYCERAKEAVEYDRRRAHLAECVEAIDDEGRKVIAHRSCVRHGRQLPAGDFSGDGSPAPRALEASNEPLTDDWISKYWARKLKEAKKSGNEGKVQFARDMMANLLDPRARTDRVGDSATGRPVLRRISGSEPS